MVKDGIGCWKVCRGTAVPARLKQVCEDRRMEVLKKEELSKAEDLEKGERESGR
jgi:hypothetical protein